MASSGADGALPSDPHRALAEVQGTLRRWSEEGPPSMFRANVGSLAQKLMDTAVEFRNAEQGGKTKDAPVFATPCWETGQSAGRVEVFARVRPFSRREEGSILCIEPDDNSNTLHVRNDGDVVESVLRGQPAEVAVNSTEVRDFSFDGVFPTDASQHDIFTSVGLPVLRDCLKGINGTILAYGQTGSGKTYSLLNDSDQTEETGLLPRLVATLFVSVAQDVAHSYQIEAAALQIYNEQIDDLLHRDYSGGEGHNLNVQGAGDVPGLTWLKCRSPDDMLEVFRRARSSVVYAETKMNKASSRSHAIFQIKVSRRQHAFGTTSSNGRSQKLESTHGKLSIVDLAGSERVKKSGCEGAQLKEAMAINKSLFTFGNVVSALADKRSYVPFRDSKLTRVLEGSIGGKCKTSLLVCTSPASDNVSETVSALEFGSRAMRVEVDAKVNAAMVEINAGTLVDDLKASFDDLGFSLGPELDAIRRGACEAIQRAQEEVLFQQKAAEEAEQKTLNLVEEVASFRQSSESAHTEVESLREKEKSLAKEVETQRKLYQDSCAKVEEQRKKIGQLESQLVAHAPAEEVLLLRGKIVEMECREKELMEELAAVELRVQAEVEQMRRERDDVVKAAAEAKQKPITKQRRSDEDDVLIQRLRREVIQLTDQLRARKASTTDDTAQAGKTPPAQEVPRTTTRIRTPTPPVRFRPNTPYPPSRSAGQTLPRTPSMESTTSAGRTPFSDLTNSIIKDADMVKDKAELGSLAFTSPTKTPVKTQGLASPVVSRSPQTFEHIDDAADIAAGRPSRSPSPLKSSPLSFQAAKTMQSSSFFLCSESKTKIFEEKPRYNIYGGVSVRSALKHHSSKDEASKVRHINFAAEEPVPRSPPKWYMEHLEILRNPSAGANQRQAQSLETTRSLQGDSPSPAPRTAGTVANTPRQFTPPPRRFRAGQGDASKTVRWRG